MQAEIISIGDELLTGQTVNTNATWMGEKLNAEGIRIYRATSIADERMEIIRTLNEAGLRSSLVFLTGGLGPTKDDVTKAALCEFFETTLVLNEEVLERIKEGFSSRNIPLLEANKKQAELPKACTIIPNERGTASGMWFERNKVIFISMPGVPHEMEHIMEKVIPKIQQHFKRTAILHRTIHTIGVPESLLAQRIEAWEDSLVQHDLHLAYLPVPGMVKLRISAYNVENEERVKNIILEKEKELHALINEDIFGYDKDTLQSVVGEMLRKTGSTLATAESCTGGYIAHLVTSVAGSSDYFHGGLVTYATEQKTNLLGVSPEIIKEHTVVSSPVAEAMAAEVRKRMNTTWAISTTGIAGPAGGTPETPVGTVWIGIAGEKGVKSFRFKFGKRRDTNILLASNAALNLLRKEMLELL